MEVFWFLHPDFVLNEPMAHRRFLEIERQLQSLGCTVTHITPNTPPLPLRACIHLFSPTDLETVWVLKKTGAKVILTERISAPAIKKSNATQWLLVLQKNGRRILQRKWTPIDDDFYYRSADAHWPTESSKPEDTQDHQIAHQWIQLYQRLSA